MCLKSEDLVIFFNPGGAFLVMMAERPLSAASDKRIAGFIFRMPAFAATQS